jgi:hypothetical protein
MKIDASVLLRSLEKAWAERTSDVELVYPYQLNRQQALLRIWACKLGNYLTAGRTPFSIIMNYSDEWIKEAVTVLVNAHDSATVVLDNESYIVDSTLMAELYAALIEFIVEIELGDLLVLYPGLHTQ